MLPSPRSRIGNPFLKSGLFVSGISAMIWLPSRFRYYSRLKMLAVIEPIARLILLAIARVSQTSRWLEVTSRPATWAHSRRSGRNGSIRPVRLIVYIDALHCQREHFCPSTHGTYLGKLRQDTTGCLRVLLECELVHERRFVEIVAHRLRAPGKLLFKNRHCIKIQSRLCGSGDLHDNQRRISQRPCV
jgi:hypothetical protein